MSISSRRQKIQELRAQLAAEEGKQALEEREEKRRIELAHKVAGESHTRIALALYDRLAVEPEHPRSRVTKGAEREVASDRNETLRSARLFAMLDEIIDEADPALLGRLQDADRDVRDSRRRSARTPDAETAHPEDEPDESDEFDSDEHDFAPQLQAV